MDTNRTCGTCTLCCRTHGVFEMHKLPGTWCSLCQVNKGCMIYSGRPKSCQEFTCAWLLGFGLSEYRPDNTGIVPDFQEIPGIGLVLYLWEAREGMMSSGFVKKQTGINLQAGKFVLHVPIQGNPRLYVPEGKNVADYRLVFGDVVDKEIQVVKFSKGRF